MQSSAVKGCKLFSAVSKRRLFPLLDFSTSSSVLRRGSPRTRFPDANNIENPVTQAKTLENRDDYIYEKVTRDYDPQNMWDNGMPSSTDDERDAHSSMGGHFPPRNLNSSTTKRNVEDWAGSKAEDLLKNSRSDVTQDVNFEFPSDVMDHQKEMNKEKKSKIRIKKDPRKSSTLLFPGQGSQFVGMGKKLLEYPNVLDMYNMANHILGYDLLKLCLEGPKSELDKTIYCQPAVLVTSLAAVEKLKHENPKAVESCVATAGFSVGEFAALTFAGTISFEDAVHLVNVRAKAMQRASDENPGGMLVVYVGANNKLGNALKAAHKYMVERQGIEKPVIKIANYLFTGCKVLAGHSEGLHFIEKVHREFGIKRVKHLPVSGAFHSELMESAKPQLADALSHLELQPPTISVFSNVTGKKFPTAKSISRGLIRQLTNQVLWEQTMHAMYARPEGHEYPQTFEVGPGSQLRTMLRLTNCKAYNKSYSVEV